jgi:flagellar biosynthesis protein FlhG
MTRVIHIAGNSGSGKSLIALNLALALHQKGKDSLLVDGNLYSPDISHYADISPMFFLNDYLKGEKELEEVIMHHPSGIRIIPSQMEWEHNPELHNRLNQAILHLHGQSELVIVDSFSIHPALFSVLDQADECIFVTNDDFPSIAKTRDFLRALENKGIQVLGVILNRRRTSKDTKHIEAILDKPVLAEITHDVQLIESVNQGQPVYIHAPKSPLSRAMSGLADMLSI